MKEWIFYLVVGWLELTGPAQKTVVLQFDGQAECNSILGQVKEQLSAVKEITVKHGQCYACKDIYEKERCPQPRNGWTSKVKPGK